MSTATSLFSGGRLSTRRSFDTFETSSARGVADEVGQGSVKPLLVDFVQTAILLDPPQEVIDVGKQFVGAGPHGDALDLLGNVELHIEAPRRDPLQLGNHGIGATDHLDLAREQGLNRRSVIVEALNDGARRCKFGDAGVLGAGPGDTNLHALEILGLRDLQIAIAIDRYLDAHIGFGEVHALGAFLCNAQGGHEEVDLVADQIGNAVWTGYRHQIDLDPHVFGQQLGHVGVEAVRLVLLVHDPEGREVDQHADVDRA